MARITFSYPDFESVGVATLMAVCRSHGHQAELVYYEAEDSYLGRIVQVQSNEVAARILLHKPDVVAFSCVTDNYRSQLACAQALKAKSPDTITIFGGLHATAVPAELLAEKAIDAVAIGEGEISLCEFLSACRTEDYFALPSHPIKGIVFKKNEERIGDFSAGKEPDIESLPFPYKEPFYSARRTFSLEYLIMSSRGCPYSCSYCFNSYLKVSDSNRRVRQRSVDGVIRELVQAKKKFNMRFVYFLDDAFAYREDWTLDFCSRYQKEIALPFACISIPSYINKRKAQALRNAGCVHMEIGIQSLNESLCAKVLSRKSDNRCNENAVKILKEEGIVIQVDHMLGVLGDTVEEEEKSVLIYNHWRPNIISVFWLTYFPKTRILEFAKDKGLIDENDEKDINSGKKLTSHSFHTGGSMKDPSRYSKLCTLLTYLPLLPKFVVKILIEKQLYRLVLPSNYYLSFVLPRLLLSLRNPKNFRDRIYIYRFLEKFFLRF